MKISGFCDLSICIPPEQFNSSVTEQLISMGYKTVAINTIVEEELSSAENTASSKKKKKNQVKEAIPMPPKHLTIIQKDGTSTKIQILQRLTLYFSDANQLQKLCKSEIAKKYDIISVIPKSSSAFQLACACKDIDLISFDASERILMMNRKMYNLAVSNGVYFEVPYAPAIIDAGQRKTTIQTAHLYYTYGKSKNVVITSGAKEMSRIRGPYDVLNLGLLFGLSEEQARHSMSNTSRALIRRAEGRRFGKTVMTMTVASDPEVDSEDCEESEDDSEPVTKKTKTDNRGPIFMSAT